MFSERFIKGIVNEYLKELTEMGRKFNKIKTTVKSRKSVTNFGKARQTFERLGYDTIEINQYIVSEDDLRNTVLHELAHLDLYARGNKHGHRWQSVARLYGKKYNTSLTRTSNKEVVVPGQVSVRVVWTEEFYKYNPRFERNKPYERKYSSMGYARNFVKKYKAMGFIETYEYLR